MSVDVTQLSREDLENIVIQQSQQLRTLQEALEFVKEDKRKLEEQYEELSDVIMVARQVLSC